MVRTNISIATLRMDLSYSYSDNNFKNTIHTALTLGRVRKFLANIKNIVNFVKRMV